MGISCRTAALVGMLSRFPCSWVVEHCSRIVADYKAGNQAAGLVLLAYRAVVIEGESVALLTQAIADYKATGD